MRSNAWCAAAAAATVLLAVTACGERGALPADTGQPGRPAPSLAIVSLTPSTGQDLSAGQSATFTVTVQDDSGARVSGAEVSVTDSVTASGAALSTDGSGVATYTTTVPAGLAPGSYALSFTASKPGYARSATVSRSVVVVRPPAVLRLAFVVQPASVPPGEVISPAVVVAVQDTQGNTVTTAADSVTLAIAFNPQGATLSGTLTVAAVGGVATFPDLHLDKYGTGYTLSASASGLTGATSASFDVKGVGPGLVFLVEPSNATAGGVITPAVEVAVVDQLGHVVTTATDTVRVTIGTNPGGGVLSGTVSVAAVNGVARFADLGIDKPGIGYALTGTSRGMAGAYSTTFDVR